MAARPILYAVDAGNDPVAEAGCGMSCGAENPSAVAEAVQRLMQYPESQRRTLGENARRYVLSYHAYDTLARRFLEVLGESSWWESTDGVWTMGRAAA